VLNSAFGFEYFLRPSFSLLGGFSTDFSAVPITSGQPQLGTVSLQREHRAGASFGMGSYGEGSQLLFGAEVSYGWGKAYAVDNYVLPNQFAEVDLSSVSVVLVVAGNTSLSTLKRAVSNLGDIVTRKP
jgi:hypothetical protein